MNQEELDTRSENAESENSFEIEFGQLPSAFRKPAIRLWRGHAFDAARPSGLRRRRYSLLAALVAVLCLVLINSFNLTDMLPAGLPLVSSDNHTTAQAAGTSWFDLRARVASPGAQAWRGMPGDARHEASHPATDGDGDG